MNHTRIPAITVLLLSLLALPAAAQDEPGHPGAAPPPDAAQPAPPAPADPLERAVAECGDVSQPCPHFATLLRLAHDPQHGPRAVTLLGRLRDPRAASTLAQVAHYGSSEALRASAHGALLQLAQSPLAREALQRVAREDTDPAVRTQAQAALGEAPAPAAGAGSPPSASAYPAAARRGQQARRVLYAPTALSEPPGSITWSVFNIGFHTLDYALNENVELSIGTVVPVAIYGALPRAKLMLHPSDSVHLGLQLTVPVFGTFIDNAGGVVLFGGGPILTVGDGELLFNASVLALGIKGYGKLLDDTDATWAVLPSIGFSWQASRWIRLNLEAFVPIVEAGTDLAGQIWAILYGLRITGSHLFADISFVLPLFPDCWEVLQYMPIGYPLLSLGYQWD